MLAQIKIIKNDTMHCLDYKVELSDTNYKDKDIYRAGGYCWDSDTRVWETSGSCYKSTEEELQKYLLSKTDEIESKLIYR